MNTTKTIIVSAIVALIVSLGLGGLVLHQSAQSNSYGANVQNTPDWYTNGVYIGALGQSHSELDAIISSSTPQNSFSVGAVTQATSSLFVAVTVPLGGGTPNGLLAVGDPCIGWLSTAPTSTAFGIDAGVSTVSSTSGLATVGVTYWNGTSTTQTIATGTLELTCFATPY